MLLKPLLILLAFLFAVPNCIPVDINEGLPFNHTERFKPVLSVINSINLMESFVDKEANRKNISFQSPEYALLLSYFISCRFYHGFSHWKMNENWIAAVGEKITGIGLSCKVDPDAIMKQENAACSQQALVMMELLKRKQIPYRKVGFPHHYALEVQYGKEWYFFDPNMEPVMNLNQRKHENWNGNIDQLKPYYFKHSAQSMVHFFGNGQQAEFGVVNEVPAQNLAAFQKVTAILSRLLFLVPLIFLLVRKTVRNTFRVQRETYTNLNPVFSA